MKWFNGNKSTVSLVNVVDQGRVGDRGTHSTLHHCPYGSCRLCNRKRQHRSQCQQKYVLSTPLQLLFMLSLSVYTCHVEFMLGHINIFQISCLSLYWNTVSGWNLSSWKAKTMLFIHTNHIYHDSGTMISWQFPLSYHCIGQVGWGIWLH